MALVAYILYICMWTGVSGYYLFSDIVAVINGSFVWLTKLEQSKLIIFMAVLHNSNAYRVA